MGAQASYRWEAVDAQGRAQRGVLEADSARGLRDRLRAEGLTPVAVEPAGAGTAVPRSVPPRELALATRQLATLTQAGMTLDSALGAATPIDASSARSPSVGGAARRHAGHSVRTSLCASTPSRLDESRYGSTPMSASRVTALAASFVCSVASTRCPVSDACTAICAVSRSRISPIITMSGSWRRIARRARANVRSTRAFTCVCATPSSAYSIGSSTVIMLTLPRGRRDSAA